MEFEGGLGRLRTAHQWRERRTMQRMALLGSALATLPALGAMLIDPMRETLIGYVPLMVIGVWLLAVIANPLITLITSAGVVAREDAREDYRKLRLDGNQPAEVASVYLEAVEARLRSLWASMWAIKAAALVSLTHLFLTGVYLYGACGWGTVSSHRRGIKFARSVTCPGGVSPLKFVPLGLSMALAVVAVSFVVLWLAYTSALHLGAYIGLRSKENANTVVTPIIGGVLAALLLITYTLYRWPVSWLPLLLLMTLGVMPLMGWLARFMGRNLEKEFDARLDRTSTAHMPPPLG